MAERNNADVQYQQRTDRRRRAVAAKERMARQASAGVQNLRQQAAQNQRAIRFGASQATAAGMTPGMGAGGGAMAAAGQIGREAEMSGIRQRQQDLDRIQSAEQQALQSSIEAEEYAAAQGTEESDFQEAIAEGTTEAEQAIQDAQGFFDDDEAGAMRKIRAMISRIRVKSPRAAAELERKYLTEGEEGYNRINSWWD